MKKIALLLLAGALLLSTNVAAQETNAAASKVTKIFDRELPNVPGKSMRARNRLDHTRRRSAMHWPS